MIVWWDVHARWYLHYSTIIGVSLGKGRLWLRIPCQKKYLCDFQYAPTLPLSLSLDNDNSRTYVYGEKRLFDDSRWEIGSNRNANARGYSQRDFLPFRHEIFLYTFRTLHILSLSCLAIGRDTKRIWSRDCNFYCDVNSSSFPADFCFQKTIAFISFHSWLLT